MNYCYFFTCQPRPSCTSSADAPGQTYASARSKRVANLSTCVCPLLGPTFYSNFTTLLPCLYDTVPCLRLYSSSSDMDRAPLCVRAQGSPGARRVPALRAVHPPPGEPYADQSCRRDCIPASLSNWENTIAGQSAGLQSLLARDYPPEFWAGFRRGPSALPRPL
jgi:hypothetical protein